MWDLRRRAERARREFERKTAPIRFWSDARRFAWRAARDTEIPLRAGPAPGHLGRTTHFFHFLFDVLLPLSHLLEAHPGARVSYPVEDVGLFGSILTGLYGERVRIVEAVPTGALPIAGWNPMVHPRSAREWADFRRHIFERTSVRPPERFVDVVLINRPKRAESGETAGEGTGPRSIPNYAELSGALRRSVPNHAELARVLGSMIRLPYRLVDAALETMPFEEQVRLFAGAAGVIGQHGAGLGHIVWMPSTSIAAEIGFRNRDHFALISRQVGVGHFLYDPARGRHAELDVAAFCDWLESETPFGRFFQSGKPRADGARSCLGP